MKLSTYCSTLPVSRGLMIQMHGQVSLAARSLPVLRNWTQDKPNKPIIERKETGREHLVAHVQAMSGREVKIGLQACHACGFNSNISE